MQSSSAGDGSAFVQANTSWSPSQNQFRHLVFRLLNWAFPSVVRLEWEMFDHASAKTSHFNFRVEFFVRITGRRPLPVLGKAGLPQHNVSTCALPVAVKKFLCCTCWEDALPPATCIGMFGIRALRPLQELQSGIPAASLRRSLHLAGVAGFCRILPSKTLCRRPDDCSLAEEITCCSSGDR